MATKDGYTVRFGMAGELRTRSQTMTVDEKTTAITLDGVPVIGSQLSVADAKKAPAEVQEIDYSAMKETTEYPEVIRENLKSRVMYSDVYHNTDIIYDMNSNQVKESIVINSYNPEVQGYQYMLSTGALTPVLNDDNSIDIIEPNSGDIIMSMPAPYMVDANEAVSTNVQVSLVCSGDTYILTYKMPMNWLAETERAWPVILDPVVTATSNANNILDQTINQLIRENNMWLNKTFVWTYDDAGNITSCKIYPYTDKSAEVSGEPTETHTYTYGDSEWGDLLTAYDGVAITYDGIGNPLSDGTWTYTWQNGRELASMSNGTTAWTYAYDANGMRTSRSNGTDT